MFNGILGNSDEYFKSSIIFKQNPKSLKSGEELLKIAKH
jgi:hypothetical protein